MPQDHRRKSTEDYDAINTDFPPPSLKAPQNDGGKDMEKPKKKEKKWSIGGLFRRKKKVSDTDSSSPVEDEEEKKGFLERRRAARKRRNRGSKDVTGSFEHVIINPPRSQNVETISPEQIRSKEIAIERLVGRSHESLAKRQEVGQIRGSSVSLETAGRKGGRIQVKARVEASREKLKADSSSDEGGGSSRHSSSSVQRSKNDENLGSKDGSLSRRTRAARTERYKKRLSRDEESFRDFQVSPPSRISRSDERLSNKKAEKAQTNNRWTAKVVYYESSDYDTKYTAKTKSATPSPMGSPKVRPKNALHYTTSAPAGSNYVTFPPSHVREGVVGSHQELRSKNYPQVLTENVQKPNQRYTDITPPRLPKSSSDMISKSPFPYSVQKQYPAWGQDVLNRKSASYDCNVNHLHYVNNQISQPHPTDENVLVVQFPISRPIQKTDTKVAKMGVTSSIHHQKQPNPPPPPPPRDPHRRLVPSNGYIHETSPRPMSYAFEDRNQHHTRYSGFPEFGSSVSAFQRVPQTTPIDIQFNPAINKHHRSSSDHQIPSRINSVKNSPPTKRRSSAQHTELISRQHPANTDSLAISPPSDVIPQTGVPHHYQYYTDQQPRSRKPIHISYQNQKPQQSNESYLSDSQVVLKPPVQQNTRARPPGVQNAADFWKQKDQESSKKIHLSEGSPKLIQRHFLNVNTPIERSRSNSPHNESHTISSKLKLPPLKMPVRGTESSGFINNQSSPRDIPSPRIPTSRKLVHNEIGIPVFDTSDVNSISKREYRPLSMLEEKQETSEQEVSPMKEKLNNPPTPPTRRDSKVNAVTSFENFDIFSDDNEGKDGGRRKSSNLEEALNELEAIYKSLRLGEEGYLEKVAKEKAVYENNRLDPSNWNAWVQSRGFESDSSFNYSRSSLESVDSIDSPLRRTNTRRSGVPDRVTDDMAYRRLNKKDRPPPQEQEVISQAGSFLLVSPTLSPPPFIEPPPAPPVKNEPDITLDDVVYRNIKHVQNTLKVQDPQPPFGIPLGPITPAPTSDYLHVTPKETYRPTFKPRKTPDVISDDLAFRNLRKDNNKEALFTPEDTTLIDSPTLKKKRAVRSLSANLLSIIQKESKLLNNNNKLLHNNNTNVQSDLEKSQSFTDVTDADNTNGLGYKNFFIEEKKLSDLSVKKNLSGDDSDTTPRVSRHFMFGTSSPMIATSSETLTGSKNSLITPDSRPPSQKMSQNSSPRLSLTPERRHTTDGILVLPRNSISPAKHVALKNEFFKMNNSTNTPKPKPMDFRRSPTPDSHTFTYHSDKKEKGPPVIYDQTESDLLAILAREAKEASEQLSKELNELNFDKKPKTVCDQTCSNINLSRNVDEQETCTSKENTTQNTVLKPLAIGKIIPHKPVKLNTFCITEDNKLENKQTIVTENHSEIEGSKSMTDLLKELTRTLDFDFGTSPKENENEPETKPEVRAEEILTPDETTEQEIFTEAIEHRPDKKETEEIYFSSVEEMPCQHLSPAESSLLSSLRETTTETEQEVHTASPVNNSFPLDLSEGNEQELLKPQAPEAQRSHRQKLNESCDIGKIQPNDDQGDFERRGDRDSSDGRGLGGCSMDCSSLADEGTKPSSRLSDPSTLLLVCMACAHQLAGLDFLTIFGLVLAMASIILFLIL